MHEDNIFTESENSQIRVNQSNSNKCNGHYASIQAGGNGHEAGDRCECDGVSPSVTISMYLPLIVIMAIIFIVKFRLKTS